jgi:O-antigen ligase
VAQVPTIPRAPAQRFPAVLSAAALLLLVLLVLGHTVALRHILMGLLLLGLVVYWRRGGMPEVPLLAPVTAWLALTLLSLAWSPLPALSARSWLDEAFYPLVLFAIFHRIGSERALDVWVTAAVCAGIGALALLSAGGYASIADDASRRGALYYYPGVGQASTLALYALPVLLIPAAHASRVVRMGALAGMAACVVVGAVTLNRMFWPAAIVAGALGGHALWRGWSKRHAVALAAAAAALAVIALAGIQQMRHPPLPAAAAQEEAPVVGQIEDIVNTDPRPELWRAWSAYALEHPWLGVGFGQRVPPLYHAERHADEPVFKDRYHRSHAHNLFINTLLQTGLPGVALLLWLLAALALRFLRARAHQPLAAWAGIALLSALLLKNATDDFMRDAVAMYFWSLAGWLLARAERGDNPATAAWKS